MTKRSFFERLGDSWDVLRNVKRVTAGAQSGVSDRLGSQPASDSDVMSALSSTYQYYRQYTHLEPDRISIYDDMDEMFQYVLAMGAMDAYVEDASQPDPRTERVVWVESNNPAVQSSLSRMLLNIDIDERASADLYQMGKYGDHFGLLSYKSGSGIYDVRELEPRICWRIEDPHTRALSGFEVGENGPDEKKSTPTFKAWDMIHWRNRSRRPTDPYGSPMFLNVRLIYKTLKLMEEQMTIYRMNMHPDRLIFKIFAGTASPDERERIMGRWRKAMEKRVSVDPQRGSFRSEHSPWAIDQNIYWPVGSSDEVSGVEKFPGCFTGDTKISLLDGTEVPIKDLVGRDEFYVYSFDPTTHKMYPGRGHSARVMRKNAELVAVTLDNGERIRCTPDHKFMKRDGSWCEAKDLKAEDSLMPLYRKLDKHGYELLKSNCGGRWVHTHRVVAREALNEGYSVEKGNVVHHKSFNVLNNDPRDLQIMSVEDHIALHTERLHLTIHSPEAKAKAADATRERYRDPEWRGKKVAQQSALMSELWEDPGTRKKMLANIAETGKVTGTKNITAYNKSEEKRARTSELGKTTHGFSSPATQEAIWTKENRVAQGDRIRAYNLANREAKSEHMKMIHQWRRETKMSMPFAEWKASLTEIEAPNNHKVVSVEWLDEREDVYDITVDTHHNFSLSAGVVVHNSANAGDLFDIRYIRDLFFAGTRVPKAYMGFEDSRGYMYSDTLSQQDIKFARGSKRLQRSYLTGLHRMGQLHLALTGADPRDPKNHFTMKMSPINHLAEQQKAELITKRMEAVQYLLSVGQDMAQSMGINTKVWATHVLREYGHIDPNVIARMLSREDPEGPDITFSPANQVLNFEDMSEYQIQVLQEKIGADDELRAVLTGLADTGEILDLSMCAEANSRAPLPTDQTTAPSSKDALSALKLHREQPAKIAKKQKAQIAELRGDLKSIIAENQKKFSEAPLES